MVTLTTPALPKPALAKPAVPPPKPALITAEEFMRMDSEGVKGELIRGRFCETMSAGGEHGEVSAKFIRYLDIHVSTGRLGRVAGTDVGVLIERGPDTVREPDAMYISAARMPLTVRVRTYYEVIPDIAVEVKSPNDSRRETHDKARMWRSHGVPLVWAAYPETRTIDVHSADGSITTLTDSDTLDGGEILPGFSVAVSDIFDL